MRPHILLALSVFVTISVIAQSAPRSSDTCMEGISGPAQAESVRFASNKPFAFVRINRSKPLQFIVDTGAPLAGIDNSLVAPLGFHTDAVISRSGGAGESGGLITRLLPHACEEMAGARLSNATVMSLDFSRISLMEGQRVDGILGGDFFRRYIIMIDYGQQSVRVLYPTFEYQGLGVVLPVSLERNHMFVNASLRKASGESVEGRFMVDTGVRVALLLNRPFTAEHKITAGLKIVPRMSYGIGVGGETRGDMFRLPELRWGALQFRNVIAFASTDKKGVLASGDFAGIIGADILRRYKVILDYPHSCLILEKTAPEQPFDYDESGLMLISEGPNFKSIRVFRVVHGSPAESAGVEEGDALLEINDREAGKLGLEQVRRMLRADGSQYVLKLQRGKAVVSVSFKTKDLLASPAASLSPYQ